MLSRRIRRVTDGEGFHQPRETFLMHARLLGPFARWISGMVLAALIANFFFTVSLLPFLIIGMPSTRISGTMENL